MVIGPMIVTAEVAQWHTENRRIEVGRQSEGRHSMHGREEAMLGR